MKIVWFVFWFFCGIWAATDAKTRNKSRFLAFLLVLLAGPIGLIIWLLFRPDDKVPYRDPF